MADNKKKQNENKKTLTLQESIEKAFCFEPKTYTEKMQEIFKNLKL